MTKLSGSPKKTRGSIRSKAGLPAKAGKRKPPSKQRDGQSDLQRNHAVKVFDRYGISNCVLQLRYHEPGVGFIVPDSTRIG